MPELAEVEYYRKQWSEGSGEKVVGVHLHPGKRVFRGTDIALVKKLSRERLEFSEAKGKQMLFGFSGALWLGIHLGMTGKLKSSESSYRPEKHDHLVLFQKKRALVFTDARQFGRVLAHQGKEAPGWWSAIAPAVISSQFTVERMSEFLERHGKLAIKSALLLQEGFPGIGNWMADEILWRAKLDPRRKSSSLKAPERSELWREARFVSREALKKIGSDFGDPPANWLFHERWSEGGVCPRDRTSLRRETIGGRTTAWCPKCQR